MSINPIGLAYCVDNEDTARGIQSLLSNYAQFRIFVAGGDNGNLPLAEQIRQFGGPCILLVSDNFLRSAACMYGGLSLVQDMQYRLLPVVVDGKKDGRDVSTSFERVTDIIQYINYWQDQYLDLRRQRHELSGLDEDTFNEHLRLVREISSEAGEFLRHLRSLDHYTFAQFTADDYHAFFNFIDDEPAWMAFKSGRLRGDAAEASMGEQVVEMEDDWGVEVPPYFGESGDDEGPVEFDEHEPMPAGPEVESLENVHHGTQQDDDETLLSHTHSEEEEDDVSSIIDETEDDNYVEAMIEKAWGLASEGDVESGLNLLSVLLEDYPEDSEIRYHTAMMLTDKKDIPGAIDELRKIVASGDTHEDALSLLVDLYVETGDYDNASSTIAQLLAIVPDHEGALSLQRKLREAEAANRQFVTENEEAVEPMLAPEEVPTDATMFEPMTPEVEEEEVVEADNPTPAATELTVDPRVTDLPTTISEPTPEIVEIPEDPYAVNNQEPTITTEPLTTDMLQEATQQSSSTPENNPLQALKENIAQLEALLLAHEAAEKRAKDALAALQAAASVKPGTGKTVFISGATSGIGKATAQRFAQEGYRLIITGRREERLQALREQLVEQTGAEVLALRFDVRDALAVQEAVGGLPENWQQVDILINNAGKAKGLDFIFQGQEDHWEEMIDTNIKGLLYLTRALSPGMVARRSGHIINVGSTAGKEVYPKGGVYCATKFAVDALTKGMRMDLYDKGIRVSQVSPAHVEETEFALVRFDGDEERARQVYDNFQPLKASDVAEVILFMASQPPHVNVLDVVVQSSQQASSTMIDRSGRP